MKFSTGNLKQISLGIWLILLISSIPLFVPPASEPKSNQIIRIMTYNIHQFYVADYVSTTEKTGRYVFEELLKVIEAANPDIIGLQENEGLRLSSGNQNGVLWLAEKLGMHYYYGPPTSAQIYGEAILSKWPIKEQEWKQLPSPEGIERGIARVVIDSPFGELLVFNTHFEIDRFKTAQREQANFVVEYVGGQKAIVLGDFNTRADQNDEAYHILYSAFTYGLVEAGFHPNATIGFSSPATDPTHKIDYIWLTRGHWTAVPNSYKTYGNPDASDHLGVLIELEMKQ